MALTESEQLAQELLKRLRTSITGNDRKLERDVRIELEDAAIELERVIASQLDRITMKNARVLALEAQLEVEQKGQGAPVLRDLEGVLRAAADAFGEQRRERYAGVAARVMLEDADIAVTIDSLAFMRDHIEGEGREAPNVKHALAAISRVVRPGTTVVQLETRVPTE